MTCSENFLPPEDAVLVLGEGSVLLGDGGGHHHTLAPPPHLVQHLVPAVQTLQACTPQLALCTPQRGGERGRGEVGCLGEGKYLIGTEELGHHEGHTPQHLISAGRTQVTEVQDSDS